MVKKEKENGIKDILSGKRLQNLRKMDGNPGYANEVVQSQLGMRISSLRRLMSGDEFSEELDDPESDKKRKKREAETLRAIRQRGKKKGRIRIRVY